MARFSPRPQLTRLEDRSTPSTLSGTVFADANGNAAQDAGERGLAGVTVTLTPQAAGAPGGTTTTDAAGHYQFAAVADGSYAVAVTPPADDTPTGPTAQAATVAGADVTAAPFGLRPNGGIAGTAFADLNGDGNRNAGEPGLPGATVTLLGPTSTVAAVTTSGADGSYQFTGVPDGAYTVVVVPPVNYQAALNGGIVVTVGGAVAAGEDVGVRPAGVLAAPVAATVGTPVVPPTTATVPPTTAVVTPVTTTGTGVVTATVPPVTAVVPPVTAVVPPVTAVVPPTTATVPPTTAVVTPVTTTGTGVVSTGTPTGTTAAATPAGSVTGTLFFDANGNGKVDTGEPPVTPAQVQVDPAADGKLAAVAFKTNPDGTFTAAGLADGTHTLVVTPSGGYAATGQNRATFTVANGSAATVPPVAVRSASDSSLAVGTTTGPGATIYTFAAGAGGQLTAAPGMSAAPPGTGGSRVVSADVNGDGVDDIITATAAGTRATIHVYDGKTGAELIPGGVPIFENGFAGGLNVAAGDFNHDGKADIVVAADYGGGPRVQVLDAAQFLPGADPAKSRLLADFFGISDPNFRGGARAAVGDLNGDGTPDLVVAAGYGGGPRVSIYDGRTIGAGLTPTNLVPDFFAFEPGLRNGAVVGVGDVNGDGKMDLVAGAGPGGTTRVTVFSGDGIVAGQGAGSARIADFYVNGDSTSRAGTQVAVKDVVQDGKAAVVATDGGKAYVYTMAGFSANYLNPRPAGPASAATLDPLSGQPGGLTVG